MGSKEKLADTRNPYNGFLQIGMTKEPSYNIVGSLVWPRRLQVSLVWLGQMGFDLPVNFHLVCCQGWSDSLLGTLPNCKCPPKIGVNLPICSQGWRVLGQAYQCVWVMVTSSVTGSLVNQLLAKFIPTFCNFSPSSIGSRLKNQGIDCETETYWLWDRDCNGYHHSDVTCDIIT